jgi:uncharacterized protein (DUF58 family)
MAIVASGAARADGTTSGLARAHVSLDELMRLKLRAKGFSFLPRQPVHSLLSGRLASRLRGRGLNFEELRRYVVGDDTRTIDWLATARLRIPHVRVYSEERDRPILLIVDQRSSMFFGSRRAMKSVAAAEAAALAAWRAASLGDRVGAIVFGDRATIEIPVRGREIGAVRVLSEIARQNQDLPGKATTSAAPLLNQVLGRAVRLTAHDWLVCLITDGAGADGATLPFVTRITEHNDFLVIFVEDPLEDTLPNVGAAIFSSDGRQIEVDTSSHSLRLQFAEKSAARRDRLSSLSKQRAIPVLPISTHRDVATQLRELIGQRAARTTASLDAREPTK